MNMNMIPTGNHNKNKKLPLRKCAVCGAMKEKPELLRLSEKKDKGLLYSYSSVQGTKGLYICLEQKCLKAFIGDKKNKKRFISRMSENDLILMTDYIDNL